MTLDQGFTIAHFLSSALVWPNRNHTSFLPTGSRTLVCPKSEPALKCRTSPLNSSCWESADYSQKHFPSEFLCHAICSFLHLLNFCLKVLLASITPPYTRKAFYFFCFILLKTLYWGMIDICLIFETLADAKIRTFCFLQ